MPGKYESFIDLNHHEIKGQDFSIELSNRDGPCAVIAIHGGKIEPGTTEIAKSIAANDLSFYIFSGQKTENNRDLHITSHNFDEPECLVFLQKYNTAISIHGKSGDSSSFIMVGGLDKKLAKQIKKKLRKVGFKIIKPFYNARGLDTKNICNRCKSGAGVQLEISGALRNKIKDNKNLLTKLSTSIRACLI